MKILKKIVCIALVILSILSISSLFVSAANTSDWYWCKVVGSGTKCVTAHRAKENSTSAYINYVSGTKSVVPVRVLASTYTTSSGGKDDGVNKTLKNSYNNYQTYYNVHTGTERGLQNTVYEDGYRSAYLRITFGTSYLGEGYWSPDSVGNYH